MDKETLSNYGWIVICVLVLVVMLAFASAFGTFVSDAVWSATNGLFDVNQNVIDTFVSDGLPKDTDTLIYRESSLDLNITYKSFMVRASTREQMGYTDDVEHYVIPVAFKYENEWYKVTSIVGSNYDGTGAFENCTNLKSVIWPTTIKNINYDVFNGCINLTSITIPDSVTSVGNNAFKNCTSLTSITIPDSVTSIEKQTFDGCTNLASITLGNSITSIGEDAFKECTNLTSITIPDKVTSIDKYAFRNCSNLTSVTLGENSQLTSIGNHAFWNCTSLTGNIIIPDGVTSIGDYAFYSCKNLTSITIPNSVTSIGVSAFRLCTNLTSITFENPNGWWYADTKDATSGTSIDVSDPATAATYLTTTYYSKYWNRTVSYCYLYKFRPLFWQGSFLVYI